MSGSPVKPPAWPVRNTAGAVARALKLKGPLWPPGDVITRVALPTTSYGNCALIRVADTLIRGTGTSSTDAQVSARLVGSGKPLAAAEFAASPEPSITISDPDATCPPSAILATDEIAGNGVG